MIFLFHFLNLFSSFFFSSGFISRENLISVLGTDHCDKLVLNMLKEGKADQRGRINYPQFLKLMSLG